MNIMKSAIRMIFLFGTALLLTGCPEEAGNELDTSLFIKNNTSDSISLWWYNKTMVSVGDSLLSSEDVSLIYNFQLRPELIISLDSMELREFENRVSKETLTNSPFGTYRYLINVDTLNNYTEITWDRKAGVKRYFLYSLSDYQQIDFTLEYP